MPADAERKKGNYLKPIYLIGAYGLKYAPRLSTHLSLPVLRARKEKDSVPFSPLEKPFRECRAALITTGGVHLKNQVPFDTASWQGDPTYREITSSVAASDLEIHHGHYDQGYAERDIDVLFPLDRLRELVGVGVLGSLARSHFGFMGFVMDHDELESRYAPEVAGKLLRDGVDLVILTPG
jgi:D-proline reductase (dithiol) PrdB